ncbi:MAG: DinB family protein, partial [Dehalococcoidia bacterium]|nr:DinB family protein [Dehalococcoidia bacterium]
MPTPKIDELLLLMDRAFADSEHSLLKNLASVRDESWSQIPQGGKRSIQNIVAHVGMFKFMYANHGFGAGDLDYGDPPASPEPERLASVEAAMDYLRQGHEYLTGCIRELGN